MPRDNSYPLTRFYRFSIYMHPGINLDSTPLMRKNSAELLNNCTFSHIEYVNFPTQEFSPLPRFRGVCLHSSFIHTFSRQFVLFPLMTSVFLLNGCSRFSMQTDFVAGSTSSFDTFLDDFFRAVLLGGELSLLVFVLFRTAQRPA